MPNATWPIAKAWRHWPGRWAGPSPPAAPIGRPSPPCSLSIGRSPSTGHEPRAPQLRLALASPGVGGLAGAVVAASPDAALPAPSALSGHQPAVRAATAGGDALSHATL